MINVHLKQEGLAKEAVIKLVSRQDRIRFRNQFVGF